MAWRELKIDTLPTGIEAAAAALTAAGFEDLVLEDQAEFETFLEGNKAYWDYIDEDLQQKLQGLSCIKLYLEDTDTAGMARLEALAQKARFSQHTLTDRELAAFGIWQQQASAQLRKKGLLRRLYYGIVFAVW